MNIMILNHYAGSDSYGMEFRPLYLGRELVKQGHEVTVIAADCSHLRARNPQIRHSFDEEWIDGVRYLFVKTVKYRRNNLKRFLNMGSYVLQLKRNADWLYHQFQPDVVIASSTYPYDFQAARKIAGCGTNTKVCFEIHDIWPLSLIELYHISPGNPYMRSLAKAESNAFRQADLTISILPDVDRHIRELGITDFRYAHIPNGILTEESRFQPAPDTVEEPIARLHREGKFVVMYLGGFSTANALEDLIASAAGMPKEAQIVMVGEGPLKEEYRKRLAGEGISNVTLLPLVTKPQVNRTLALADALYIGAKRSRLYAYGVGMNKIFDYMLSKRPIIYAVEASNDPISDAECGITIPAEDPEAICGAVRRLLALPKERLGQMGENGYRYVRENHDYQVLAKRFADALEALFSEPSR